MPNLTRLSTSERTLNHIPGENVAPLGFNFSYAWNAGGGINTFITSIYATYPYAFASNPFYTSGSGGANSTLQFTLALGFRVSYYFQSGLGSETITTSITGGTYSLFTGNTVSGLSGPGLTVPGSGNNNSSLIITYVGA